MTVAPRRPPATSPVSINMSNGFADPVGFPGTDENGQTPRGRVDENELIARNAEPPEGSQMPQGGSNASGDARPPSEERRTGLHAAPGRTIATPGSSVSRPDSSAPP